MSRTPNQASRAVDYNNTNEFGNTTVNETDNDYNTNLTFNETDFGLLENTTDTGLLDDVTELFADVTYKKPGGSFLRGDEIAVVVIIFLLATILMLGSLFKSYTIGKNEKKLRRAIEAANRKREKDPKSWAEPNELTEDVMCTAPMNGPLVDVSSLPIPPLMKPKKKPKRNRKSKNIQSESSRPETSNAQKSPPKPTPTPSPAQPSPLPAAPSTGPTDHEVFDTQAEVSCIDEVNVEVKK